jgi:hypothetical protein
MKTQLILLCDCSRELCTAVAQHGPILCATTPVGSIYLRIPPALAPESGRVPLTAESIKAIERSMALSCEYEDDVNFNAVRHELQQVAVAIQLAKPTRLFLGLWLQLDADGKPEYTDRSVRDFGILSGPAPYLQYQQHNTIEAADLKCAFSLLPRVAKALDSSNGSWEHLALPIHRAIIFFCQGYAVRPDDPIQFLWAAGLDCLYASKLDRKKQGSREICSRLGKFLGAGMKPYDGVSLPMHQEGRKRLPVEVVASDVFKLRNAFAHGLPIPDADWLGVPGRPFEQGYAYQLLEQTEILLRLSLLKILEDQQLFETFTDRAKLDLYFRQADRRDSDLQLISHGVSRLIREPAKQDREEHS